MAIKLKLSLVLLRYNFSQLYIDFFCLGIKSLSLFEKHVNKLVSNFIFRLTQLLEDFFANR